MAPRFSTARPAPKDAPAILLLHGFPTSSHQYRGLIGQLADKYRVIAPDLPGFGFSDAPDAKSFGYTFDHLAEVIEGFTDAIGLTRYALYVFDYGAPVGFRLAVSRPERVAALISQNGNAYEEGLCDGWNPIRAYWQNPTVENRANLRSFLKSETTSFQYTHGESDISLIAPESYTLDQHFLDRPGNDEIQLDLFADYKTNVAAYPQFQEYFRTHRPPTLAVWGKNDPFFLPSGAEAYRRDIPDAEIHFVDAGHFPLETHLDEVARIVRGFLARTLDAAQGPALFGALGKASGAGGGEGTARRHAWRVRLRADLGYALAAEPAVLGAYIDMLQSLGATRLIRSHNRWRWPRPAAPMRRITASPFTRRSPQSSVPPRISSRRSGAAGRSETPSSMRFGALPPRSRASVLRSRTAT